MHEETDDLEVHQLESHGYPAEREGRERKRERREMGYGGRGAQNTGSRKDTHNGEKQKVQHVNSSAVLLKIYSIHTHKHLPIFKIYCFMPLTGKERHVHFLKKALSRQ